jgi:hypothetical protein
VERRVEVHALLEAGMFGRAPGRPSDLAFEVTATDKAALGGRAVRRSVAIRTHGKTLDLQVYLPAGASARVPVFLCLGFQPNQSVTNDASAPLAAEWVQDPATRAITLKMPPESSRGTAASRWQLEKVLARGYALATMYYGDIEPDFPGAAALGIRHTFLRPGQGTPGDEEWGMLAADAWGLSRALDYLETDRDVDATRVAVVGHSRLGKAALWAGAHDRRFAMVVSNDSGEGGAAISRRAFGETVDDLNSRFPHWFCGAYKRWSGREAAMPFDSHMLLALVAPRPLYVASAEEDQWADPKGEFLGAAAASAVWELLGRKGIGTGEMPKVHQPVGEAVRYHVRAGKHDITAYDWDQYLDFADRWLKHQP